MTNPSDNLDLSAFEAPEYLISKVNSAVRERMNFVLRQYGLKLVEWRILQVLAERDSAYTINELAELCVVERTVISKIIDRMIGHDLLKKTQMETDRRHSLVTSTPEGAQIYAVTIDEIERVRARIFKDFSAEDMRIFIGLLERMQMNLGRVV